MKTLTSTTNTGFYANIDVEKFREIAKQSGFDNSPDLALIYSMIKKSKAIAEIGLGYGRCIDALLEKGFEGQIYAVERVEKFAHEAQKKYSSQVTILHEDVVDAVFPEKLDAVLWLWSGIMELTMEEQESAICKLKGQLNPNGAIFIDVPLGELKVVGTKINDRKFVVEADWGRLEAYLPLEEDMKKMAKNCGYTNLSMLKYETEKGLKRVMYVLLGE